MDIQETELAVKKVSQTNYSVTLAGAQFRLYRLNEAGVREYYCRNADTVTWETAAEKALVVTTGENGLSTENFTKLSDGTYYLDEIKAPNGYAPLTNPVKLKLQYAELSQESTSYPQEAIKRDDNSFCYTITVPNYSGHVLPNTGGPGSAVYYSLGAALLLAAWTLLLTKRRRPWASR